MTTQEKGLVVAQKQSGFLSKAMDKVNTKTTAIFCLAVAGLSSNMAFALDASNIVSEIGELKDPLTKIGVAVIGVVLVGFGIAKAKGMIK